MAFRQNTYNEGGFYRLLPVARMPVVPGQSAAIKMRTRWSSVAFLQNLLSGGVAHLYAFYVPYRLVWDQWIDFASDADSTLTLPTTTTVFPQMFEKAGTNVALGRRAYKLIYNQFFGSDEFGTTTATWYDDITDDADVTLRRLRSTDQLSGKISVKALDPDRVFKAPVTGAVADISLNDFRQALGKARSQRRQQMTGDKYVDAMRRMGVNLDWRVQMAPEFLGQALMEFEPRVQRSTYGGATADTPLGSAYTHFMSQIELSVGRKFFAEHGEIIAVLAIRPHLINKATPSPVWTRFAGRDAMFWGDNQVGVDTIAGQNLGLAAGQDAYVPGMQWLKSSQNLEGETSTQPWLFDFTAASLQDTVYPSGMTVVSDDSLSSSFATWTQFVSDGPSPVRKMVM